MTLNEWIAEYRKEVNPITGQQRLFKDITDEMVWNAAQEEVRKEKSADLGRQPGNALLDAVRELIKEYDKALDENGGNFDYFDDADDAINKLRELTKQS
jgi:L-lactate utilization protein LutB